MAIVVKSLTRPAEVFAEWGSVTGVRHETMRHASSGPPQAEENPPVSGLQSTMISTVVARVMVLFNYVNYSDYQPEGLQRHLSAPYRAVMLAGESFVPVKNSAPGVAVARR